MPLSDTPVYTDEQVERYLAYVGMPDRIAKEDCGTEKGLKWLNKLVPLQLAKIPFENLDLHYSPHHVISLDSEYLFHKIVDRNAGRGGYCMQNNHFFATILRSLGFTIMRCGSRVSTAAQGVQDPDKITYHGFSHTVTIVYIAGKKYFVDVGFGANNPNLAIPMVDGWTGGLQWKDHDDMLLSHSHVSESTTRNDEQKLWLYHKRASADAPWLPYYCFAEIEFLPQDFEIMSYFVSRSLKSFFTYALVARKCLLDENGNDVGEITMFNGNIKKTLYNKSEVLVEAKSEKERVDAMEKYLGIKLDASEVNGIIGYISMLRG